MTPLDLPAEFPGGTIDPLLCFPCPADSVVGGHRGHLRNRASRHKRPYVLDPLFQSLVQGYRFCRVEKSADGVDHPGDTIFGECGIAAEIHPVLALHQSDVKLAVAGWLEVQRIDSEIVAAIDNPVERLLVLQIEGRSDEENQERQ